MLQRAIEQQPGLEVVSEVTDLAALALVVDEMAPEWLIVSLEADGQVPGLVHDLLMRQPSLHILALGMRAGQARVKWLAPHEEIWDDVSLYEVIQILRRALPVAMPLPRSLG
jgi:hypothetical protein